MRDELVFAECRLAHTTPESDAPTRAGARCTRAGCSPSTGSSLRAVLRHELASCRSRTAAIAGFASVAASTYHWSVSHGSITASPRCACGTACVCASIFSTRPSASRSATTCLRAAKRSRPRYFCRRARRSACAPGVEDVDDRQISCRLPTSKSLKSCAGVIFTAPEPFSGSEYSSAMIGISRPTSGSTHHLADQRLVALVLRMHGHRRIAQHRLGPRRRARCHDGLPTRRADQSFSGYLKCHRCPLISMESTSRSDTAVWNSGSQLTSRLSL